jgi:hypothetical protein
LSGGNTTMVQLGNNNTVTSGCSGF